MSSRVRIAAGAPIYQQHLTGWLDLRRADSERRTLATTDRRDAATLAHEVLTVVSSERQLVGIAA
jgi:hypothetical protein